MAIDELGLDEQAAVISTVIQWNHRGLNGPQLRQLKAAEKTLADLADLRRRLEEAMKGDDEPDADQFADEIVALLRLQGRS